MLVRCSLIREGRECDARLEIKRGPRENMVAAIEAAGWRVAEHPLEDCRPMIPFAVCPECQKGIGYARLPDTVAPDAKFTVGLLGKSPVQSIMEDMAEIREISASLSRPRLVVDNDN